MTTLTDDERCLKERAVKAEAEIERLKAEVVALRRALGQAVATIRAKNVALKLSAMETASIQGSLAVMQDRLRGRDAPFLPPPPFPTLTEEPPAAGG